MNKKFVYIKEKDLSKRYLIFQDSDTYYLLDAYFYGIKLYFFPIMIYFKQFPLYKISTEEAIRLLNHSKQKKYNIWLISSIMIPIGIGLEKLDVHLITKKTILILYLFLMGIGAILGLYYYYHYNKIQITTEGITDKMVKFKLKLPQFLYLIYFICLLFFIIYISIFISIKNHIINFIFIILCGLALGGSYTLPYHLCRISNFKIIEKRDKL